MVRSPAKLATLIVLGTFIGGAIGFYVRENWNLKERVCSDYDYMYVVCNRYALSISV